MIKKKKENDDDLTNGLLNKKKEAGDQLGDLLDSQNKSQVNNPEIEMENGVKLHGKGDRCSYEFDSGLK